MIKASASNVNLNSTRFKYNYAYEAGVIHIDNEAYLEMNNVIAESNYAELSAGVIQVLTYSTMEVYSCQFDNNYAGSASVINIL